MISLSQVIRLAADCDSGAADSRPSWLRQMPSASDSTALYYRFFHELVKRHGPFIALEIGTYYGTSAAHLAYANHGGFVRTIDCESRAKTYLDDAALGRFENYEAVTADSLGWASEQVQAPVYDLLFIDGLHTATQAAAEHHDLRPLVREGGLVFFDDINLGDMDAMWQEVAEPKARLDELHYTGFGVCQVQR